MHCVTRRPQTIVAFENAYVELKIGSSPYRSSPPRRVHNRVFFEIGEVRALSHSARARVLREAAAMRNYCCIYKSDENYML